MKKPRGSNGVATTLLTPQYEPAPRRSIWIWKVCHSLLGLQILKYFVMLIPWTTIFQILEFKFSTFSKFWMEIFEIGRLGADSFCGVIISSSYCGVKWTYWYLTWIILWPPELKNADIRFFFKNSSLFDNWMVIFF